MRVSSPCASQRDVCTQYRHQGGVQLFIQAKAFRDGVGWGDGEKQKGSWGGRMILRDKRGWVETDGARGKYIQRYSNIESVSYRNRKCR